jgi:hypothetical protein
MISGICFLCGASSSELGPNQQVLFVDLRFLDRAEGEEVMCGPAAENFGYFCSLHYPAAQELSHLPYREAMAELERRFGKFDPVPPPQPGFLKRWLAKWGRPST